MGRKWPSDMAERRRERRTRRRDALAEAREDAADVALVAERMANDTGVRYSLDEVMAMFGITRADLDAVRDDTP